MPSTVRLHKENERHLHACASVLSLTWCCWFVLLPGRDLVICVCLQEQCKQCGRWTVKKKGEWHHLCRSCNNARIHGPIHHHHQLLSSSSSSSRPLFDHQQSSLSHLSEHERTAIVALSKLGEHRPTIAQQIPCSLNAVSRWTNRWEKNTPYKTRKEEARKRKAEEATDAIIDLAHGTQVHHTQRDHS